MSDTEIYCEIADLPSYFKDVAAYPTTMVCSARTEETINASFKEQYTRWTGAKKMWECHEYGLFLGTPVLAGKIATGKVRLYFK